MLMTWIEMLVLFCALGGVAVNVRPQPRRGRVRALGRFIPGRRAAQLEYTHFVRYGARGSGSFPEGLDFP